MTENADKETVQRAILLINDLIFQTRILSTARDVGLEMTVARSADDLASAIENQKPNLVVVDLNTAADAIRAIESAKAHPARPAVVAFVSHVDVDLARAAEAAGADRVLPRSRFSHELGAVLRGDLHGPAPER